MRHNRLKQALVPSTQVVRTIGTVIVTLGILLGIWAFERSASARPVCMPHAELEAQLSDKFSEHQAAAGLDRNGHLIEVYSTNDGATWTIVMTKPSGLSCIVASGEAWHELDKGTPGLSAEGGRQEDRQG